jgi:hypothetical protein
MVHNDNAWTESNILKKPIPLEVYPPRIFFLEAGIARPVRDTGVVEGE